MEKNYLTQLMFFIGIVTMLFVTSSCSDDSTSDVCNASTYDQRIMSITSSFSTAAQDYGTNPNDANCQAFLEAYGDYIDFLKEFRDCSFTVNGSDLNQVISESEAQRNDLPCS